MQVCNCWPPVSVSNCYDFSPLIGLNEVSDRFTKCLLSIHVHVICVALPACVDACAELHNDPVCVCMSIHMNYILFMLSAD